MPQLVTFEKPFLTFKAGDTGEVPDDDFKYLSEKGVVKKAETKQFDDRILALMEEKLTPGIMGGFETVLKATFDKAGERVKAWQAPKVSQDDDGFDLRPSVLVRKSSDQVAYRHLHDAKPMKIGRTQKTFPTFGHFASHVRGFYLGGGRVSKELEEYANLVEKSEDYEDLIVTKADPTGMGEALGSDGSILVPPEFSMRIFERVYSNPLLQMTETFPIRGNQITFPAVAERSRATGSRQGGIRSYWQDEAAQYTLSKPTLRKVKYEPSKITVLCRATEELLEDSPILLDQFLGNKAVEEINFGVGNSIFRGTGSGQPQGLLNAAATISISKESGQAAATLVSENILKMWARMWGPSRMNSVWFYNQDIEPQLNQMSLAVGTGGQLTYTPPGGLSMAPFATLMGRPMIPLEFCSTLGTVGDLVLCDLSQYYTVTRGAVHSAVSMHLRFDYDEATWKFRFRLDGKPIWDSALTPFQGTNTQSPFITLATRA